LNCIVDSIRREREYSGIIETVEKQIKSKNPLPMLVTGMCEGARLSFYASLCEDVKKLTGHGILLVIADENKPVALAGVMGGANSEIKDTTATVVFESANFNGPSVRVTAKKLGMRTESSARFEKGLDAENTLHAVERACELV
jgi:hypothetical protein